MGQVLVAHVDLKEQLAVLPSAAGGATMLSSLGNVWFYFVSLILCHFVSCLALTEFLFFSL